MQFLTRLDRIISSGLKWSLIILMMAITFAVSWGVFTRFVLQASATWTGEFSGFALVWITFVGTAYATYRKNHIRFESLFDMMPEKIRLVLQTIFNLMMVAFFSIILSYGFNLTLDSLSTDTVSLPISKGVVYSVLPIGSVIIIIGMISESLKTLLKGGVEVRVEALHERGDSI